MWVWELELRIWFPRRQGHKDGEEGRSPKTNATSSSALRLTCVLWECGDPFLLELTPVIRVGHEQLLGLILWSSLGTHRVVDTLPQRDRICTGVI